jgi:general secretion pathway protein K
MAATNARDEMRAHFLARSGANLAQLILRVQTDVIDAQRQNMAKLGGGLGDFQLADYVGFFMGAFGGSKEEVQALSEMLGGFEGEAMKGLGVAAGHFEIEITSEDGKLNVNCANGSAQSRNTLKSELDALFFNQGYNRLFEDADAENWRRDRQQQAAAIIDYIDGDNSKFDAPGTNEEYGYESLDDQYLPKNTYLDTVGEINLIRGVDDRFWTLFGGHFTVYGDCKINLGAVRDPRLMATVIYLAAKSPDDPVIRDSTGQKLWALSKKVVETAGFSSFDSLQAFHDYVKDPMTSAAGLLALLGGLTGTNTAPTSMVTLSDGTQVQVQGVDLDMTKLQQIAVIGPRRIYRVEVNTEVGRVKKRLTAIWDVNVQNQNSRNPAYYPRGNWVFWREE